MTTYTISQLAKAADVPTSTLRYYERCGLLRPKSRAKGEYRAYDDAALARLRFIRGAQVGGLKLADVRELLLLLDDEDRCAGACGLLTQRLGEVRRQIGELREMEGRLAESLERCRRDAGDGPCEGLERVRRAEREKYSRNPRKGA